MTDDIETFRKYVAALESLALQHEAHAKDRAEESLMMMQRITALTAALQGMTDSLEALTQQLVLSGVIRTPDLRGNNLLA